MAGKFIQKLNRLSDLRYGPTAVGIGYFNGGLFANLEGTVVALTGQPSGTTYFVDVNNGVDTDSGKSWGEAFLTMSKAFTSVATGDTIRFRGKVREQLTTPANIFDVTVIGEGNRPRHADTSPSGGNTANNTWTTPLSATAVTPLVKVIQQGWRFVNILFAGPTDAACILLDRTAEGASEHDASHLEVIGCRFASGYDGISDTGGCYGVLIQDCRFLALTNFCILGVGNIGVGQSDWHIKGNQFDGGANHLKIAAYQCWVTGNVFDDGGTPNTTVVCNVTGANNFVVDNYFQTATANFNTPDVVGNTTDVWYNTSIDSFSAGLESGHEVGRPA